MSKESSPRDTMHRRDFNKLLSAAVAGMVGAGALAGCRGTDDRGGAPAADKHACKGLNDCKGKGGCKTDKNACKGQNECKGQGGCATAAKHECKGQNECKGLGGCKTGDNGCVAKNSCKGKGGCAVPVKHG